MIRVSAISALALLASCGGSNSIPGQSCTLTLTGAVTATITACSAAATYDPNKSQGAIAIGVTTGTPPAPVKSIAILYTLNTDISTGTFTYATANVTEVNLEESNTDNSIYAGTKTSATGTASVVISSTNFVGAGSSGVKAYLPHGTVDATIPSATGAATSITVHGTF